MSFVVAALLLSAQAAAEPQPVAPATAVAPAADQQPIKIKKKVICKVEEADSGSRMAKRTCRTAEEWNQRPELGAGRSGFSISGEAMQSH